MRELEVSVHKVGVFYFRLTINPARAGLIFDLSGNHLHLKSKIVNLQSLIILFGTLLTSSK